MTRRNPLDSDRGVWVVGGGLHRYQRASETTYVTLGLTAIRAALTDAGMGWSAVDSAYVGTATLGISGGREMMRYLGGSGLAITHVENASASGSSAFRQAVIDVAAGFSDVALAVGVDKPGPHAYAFAASGTPTLIDDVVIPLAHYALLAQEYLSARGATVDQLAQVAVKNHRNGSRNPFAHRQQERSLSEVLAPPFVAGPLTRLQCTPVGEGAAAVLIASDDAMDRLHLDRSRAVRVVASVSASERLYGTENFDEALTRSTARAALEAAGIGAGDLDVVEVHDAFSVEELIYAEAIGISAPGEAAHDVATGQFDIGGRVAVSASGGLLSMGHPTGPTGVGQIVEIMRQLRGEAGDRQHPGARWGLAHMVGLGAVCVVHVLEGHKGSR